MAGLEEADLSIGEVPFEGFSPRRQKERIVLAPDRQKWWAMLPEILLEGGIERDVAGVVEEEIQLNLIVPGASEKPKPGRSGAMTR